MKGINNTLFLTKKQDGTAQKLSADEICRYNKFLCNNDIDLLPAAWAGASNFTKDVKVDYTVEYVDIRPEKGMLRCTGEKPSIRLKFRNAFSPFLMDFLFVTFAMPNGKRLPLKLNFAGDNGLYSDASNTTFFAAPKNRVPTLTNVYWLYSEGIREISITPSKMAINDIFSCEVRFEALFE
jgi:hypothetical protein